MDLKEILKVFEAKDEAELRIKKGNDNLQSKVYSSECKRVKLTEADCKRLCKKAGVEYLEGYEERVLRHRITDETVDRYGDIVRAKGVDLTNYKKNPVIQFAHKGSELPVGNSIRQDLNRQEKALYSDGLYMDERVDPTGRSDTVFKMADNHFLRAVSIGFMPIETIYPSSAEEAAEMGLGRWGVDYTKCDLMEYSNCSVPANPNALENMLKEAKAKDALGIFNQDDVNVMSKFKFFEDDNALDMFVESLKKSSPTVIEMPDLTFDFKNNEEPSEPSDDPENPEGQETTPEAVAGSEEASEGSQEGEESGSEGEEPETEGKTPDIVVNNHFDFSPLEDFLKEAKETLTKLNETVSKMFEANKALEEKLTTDAPEEEASQSDEHKESLYDDNNLDAGSIFNEPKIGD